MRTRTIIAAAIAALVALIVVLFVQVGSDGDGAVVRVGAQKAEACSERKANCLPNIAMRDLDGAFIDPGSMKGKVVLINVWATWCKPCKKEIPDLVSLREVFDVDDFMLVGVVSDVATDAVVKAFAKQHHINYPVVRMDDDVSAALGEPRLLPTTFIYDRFGKLKYEATGIKSEGDLALEIESLL